MTTIRTLLKGEEGLVLVMGLMFLGILCVLGSTGAMLTAMDIKIGSNHKASVRATYAAIAGHGEARARLASKSIEESGTPTTTWRGFIGDAASAAAVFGYDSTDSDHHLYTSIQSDLNYVVMIRHQVDGAGNVLLWGDTNADYIYEENLTTGDPIEIVTSCGLASNARKRILVRLKKEAAFNDSSAALYVNGNLEKFDAAGAAVGDYNAACTPVPDIITTMNAGACPPPPGRTCEASDWPAGTGSPAWLVSGATDIYPVPAAIDLLSEIIDNMITPAHYVNPTGWGSAASPNEVTYCNGNLSIRNLTGYGVLVVTGDMTLTGNINWYGIMIVQGLTTLSGGGHMTIYGSLISDSVANIDGTPRVYYDCQVIDRLADASASYHVDSWTEYPDLIYYP